MNIALLGGDGARRAIILGAVPAVLVLAFLGYLVFTQQREVPKEAADLTETLDRGEAALPAPTAHLYTPKSPAQSTVRAITDASRLFRIELPADWAITRNEGRKGIQLSFLGAQSLDFQLTLDETADEPFTPRRYEQGAAFSARVVRGRSEVDEESARTAGLLEPSPVTIGGVSGVLRAGAGISTVQGRNFDAIIHKDGLNYIFTFGYNPETYPHGEQVFRMILASMQFTTSTTPPPTPVLIPASSNTATPPSPNASSSSSAPNTPTPTRTPSPYGYQRPKVGE